MGDNKNNIDLTIFCAGRSGKEWMRTSFNFHGLAVATNGHVLICAPAGMQRLDTPFINKSVEKIINDAIHPNLKLTPLKIKLPQKKTCADCGGVGKLVKCQECDGDGIVDFDGELNSYSIECQSCAGPGYKAGEDGDDCLGCLGTGLVFDTDHVMVDGVPVSPLYLDQLLSLGDIEVSRDQEEVMLYFKIKGDIRGVLMGMRI